MKKIENIIESCRECRHCQTFTSEDGKRVARICGYEELCNPDEQQRILGCVSSVSVGNPIPSWCPLETYKDAEKFEAQPETAPCYIGQSKVDEKIRPSTIILPGMPHLEWMTENLSGYGGTEIDGRWYYIYDEAVAAVKQLGNGWRLMTPGEAVDLCNLGSEWQEDGPHGLPGRLFGGGLFLPASGYRSSATGALGEVGTTGRYWSSSTYASGFCSDAFLRLDAGLVLPLDYGNRTAGRAVRCVRNVK